MSARKPATARIHVLSSARPGNLSRRQRRQGLWSRALDMPWIWAALLVVAGGLALSPEAFLQVPLAPAHLAAGSVASRDYVASRDLMLYDAAATQAKHVQARDRVMPVYDFDSGTLALRDAQLAQLFAAGRDRLPAARSEAERAALARQLAAPAGMAGMAGIGAAAAGARTAGAVDALRLDPDAVTVLVHSGFSAELEDRLRGVLAQTLRRGVVEDKALLLDNRVTGIVRRNLGDGSEQTQFNLFDYLGYPDEARDFLESEVRGWSGLTYADRHRLASLLFDNLSPDMHLNRTETLARRRAAEDAAGDAFSQIRRGQIIARKGDVIDDAKARLLQQMRGERQPRSWLPEAAGTLLLMSLAAAALWLGLAGQRVADPGGAKHRRLFGESVLLLGATLVGERLCFLICGALTGAFRVPPFDDWRGYALAVPFAALAMSAALLLGRQAALVSAVLCSLLAGRLAIEGEGLWVALYALAGSLAAIFVVERLQFRQRLVLPRAGLIVGAVNVLMAGVWAALAGAPTEAPVQARLFEVVLALTGGLLAAAVAGFTVPILEALLGITTDIKLVELSNTNLPLLRRLAFEAPGTFQHSLMVANLAKEGCEAIGADAVLAYAGALYHDIGKVFRADYFIENQRPGENRHDRLLPSMSVLVLANHVKEGADLGRRNHLPQVLLDAIEQHHGTRLMRFFYGRALEQHGRDAAEVREEDFRYPGPRPQTKVMGVLMLADGVEAASRTLTDPSPAKLRGLIRTLLDDCLQDGQLDQTDLTLSDLRAVSEAFLRVLATIFHQRVDYPGFDFNAAGGSASTAVFHPAGGRDKQRPATGAFRVS
jgi:cyclic-di-AMP phosphodiesterase PgpH